MKHLLKHMAEPGLLVWRLFARVAEGVEHETRNLRRPQRPYQESNIRDQNPVLVPERAENDTDTLDVARQEVASQRTFEMNDMEPRPRRSPPRAARAAPRPAVGLPFLAAAPAAPPAPAELTFHDQALLTAAQSGTYRSVFEAQAAVGHGADVNCSRADGVTPLIHASFVGHHDIVQLLLNNRADVNAADRLGWHCLDGGCGSRTPGHISGVDQRGCKRSCLR